MTLSVHVGPLPGTDWADHAIARSPLPSNASSTGYANDAVSSGTGAPKPAAVPNAAFARAKSRWHSSHVTATSPLAATATRGSAP